MKKVGNVLCWEPKVQPWCQSGYSRIWLYQINIGIVSIDVLFGCTCSTLRKILELLWQTWNGKLGICTLFLYLGPSTFRSFEVEMHGFCVMVASAMDIVASCLKNFPFVLCM